MSGLMAMLRAVLAWLNANASLIEKTLMVIATCFAAVASWFSYVATNEASAIAGAAYDFTLRAAEDASALQRPILTILGGKITPGEIKEDSYDFSKRRSYRVELHVRNSGARDAKPVWIGLATDKLAVFGEAWTKSNIPKDQEVTLFFDLEGGERDLEMLQKVTVAAGFMDSAPKYEREQRTRGQTIEHAPATFVPTCGEPIVQEMSVHLIKADSGNREVLLSLGRSIPLSVLKEKKPGGVDSVSRKAWDAMSNLNAREIQCGWSS
jgi:hypothetical protein